ncbi:MAG: hypothetical protein M1829_001308 [Trizodia sp. TS-e1964]|nr:MAG: hypothetical protein M1829_001308 [Trizodia sp. TS-e1964]
MKLTFKDLKQQKFVIEAEPSELISEIKEKISKEKGWDASQQKLIYSGKILKDSNTVESYKIVEKDFIVCMLSKLQPKVPIGGTSATTPSTPAAPISQTPVAPPAPGPAPAFALGNVVTTPSPARVNPGIDAGDLNTLASGDERAAAITMIEGMGFPRADIDAAMIAAFNNPNRAIEYLCNGIPENLRQRTSNPAVAAAAPSAPIPTATGGASATANAPADAGDAPINLFEAAAQAGRASGAAASRSSRAAPGTGATAEPGSGAAGNLGNLDFLRLNPQFQQLRQVVQQQPLMLEPILQQVGAGNPQLAQLIGQNPEQFLQLLAEDVDEDAPLPPGAQSISVTEEEREAIERLCRLGFSRDMVIEAYFACEKNEELAANFLFDQPDDADEN